MTTSAQVPDAVFILFNMKKLNCCYVPNTDNSYRICDNGLIISLKMKKPKLLKPEKNKNGYLQVVIVVNGEAKMKTIHRIVAECFIENIDNKPTVNHINGIKHDNRVENLEWNTRSENIQHSVHVLKNKHGKKRIK